MVLVLVNKKGKRYSASVKKITKIYLLLGIIIAGLLIIFIFFPESKKGIQDKEIKIPLEKVVPVEKPVPEKKPVKGRIYFVIDDVGNNTFQLEKFLKLPFKITFAILPGLSYTKETADMINAAGKEYIIHQPMDAVGEQKTGPGAIHLGMNEDTVEQVIQRNLKDLPFARGMNNHMGSLGTADEDLMVSLFKVLKKKDMFFLDSRTTSKSVGRKVARKIGIPFAERSVFLDNNKEKKSIKESIEKGIEISENKGHAVMIGHIWTAELAEVLLEIYPTLLEDNYTLNNLTELFMGYNEDEDTWY